MDQETWRLEVKAWQEKHTENPVKWERNGLERRGNLRKTTINGDVNKKTETANGKEARYSLMALITRALRGPKNWKNTTPAT